MKRIVLAILIVAMLAGCSAKGSKDDFFGYMKKPLYASSFNLERTRAAPQSEQFFVEDGSIGTISIQIWVNATAGAGTVQVYDPTGAEVIHTMQSMKQPFSLSLGAWKIVVTASPDAVGKVDALVTRGK